MIFSANIKDYRTIAWCKRNYYA